MIDLDQQVARFASAELELQAKGFTQQQAEMGTQWASRWALGMMKKLPPAQQGVAYPALFEDAMISTPAYLDGCRRAAERREYKRGLRRAAKDGEFKRGMQEYGPAKVIDKAWRGSLDQAESAWDCKFRPAPP